MIRHHLLKTLGFFAVLTVTMFTVSCRPAMMVIPPHIHNVGIDSFENRTTDYGLETLLTSWTIRQFQSDGRLPLEDADQADLQVHVILRQYSEEPILYDTATNYPLQIRLTVTYDLIGFDRKEGKPIVEEKNRVRSVFYYTPTYQGAATETEEQARERLADEVGRAIVRKVLEGF